MTAAPHATSRPPRTFAPSGYEDEIPNEETLEAIREAEERLDDLPSYGSVEEMMEAIEREIT